MVLIAASSFLSACADNPRPINPSFPISRKDASRAFDEMKRDRKPLDRPLVIIGGYLDVFNYNRNRTNSRLREAIDDDRIVLVSVGDGKTMKDLRRKLIEAVERRFPSEGDTTTEVDVVAHSMGGLI